MTDFDSPWKEAIEFYPEDFLQLLFPQVHAAVDWNRGYEYLDKELQQIVRDSELGRRYVDKLVKVWLKDGEEKWILIHIEVQGDEEAEFSQRMFVYYIRLFDNYKMFHSICGTVRLQQMLDAGASGGAVIATWQGEVRRFMALRARYLMY